MTEMMEEKPQLLGEAKTNSKSNSSVTVRVSQKQSLLFYRPETNEILVVDETNAGNVLEEIRLLDQLMWESIQAKEACLKASDNLLKTQRASRGPDSTVVPSPLDEEIAKEKMDAANKRLEEAQAALQDEFKPLGQLNHAGGQVYELIPVMKRSMPNAQGRTAPQRNGHAWGKKWTYVRSDRVRNHFRSYQLNASEQAQLQGRPSNSIIGEDGKIDTGKLRKQINQLQAKAQWQKLLAQGSFADDLNKSIEDSLTEWADSLNLNSKYFEFKPEAQLLRYFAGASAQADWNPAKGEVALRANAQAEFALAEGRIQAAAYWPGRGGVMLKMTGPSSKREYKAGLVRGNLTVELSAMAGASVSAQLGVVVNYTDASNGIIGMRGRPTGQTMGQRSVDIGKEIRDASYVGGEADIFAGAKAGGKLYGALEWNSPEEKKFTALCKVGPGIEAQAGVGASATFMVSFIGGKFRIRTHASVCLGVGAGGSLLFEVDPAKTLELCKYVSYMLYSVGYEYCEELFDDGADAYKLLTAYQTWALQTGNDISKAVNKVGDVYDDVMRQLLGDFEKEEARTELVDRIAGEPTLLEYATPEAKGMLLYQLTRHDYTSAAGMINLPGNSSDNNSDWEWSDLAFWDWEFARQLKEAIITICKKARSQADFQNIMQHMTRRGSKDPKGWQANFAHVKRVLAMGKDTWYLPENDIQYDKKLQDIYDNLYDDINNEPLLGYAFVDNTTELYRHRAGWGDQPGYLVAGGYDPGSVTPPLFDRQDNTRFMA